MKTPRESLQPTQAAESSSSAESQHGKIESVQASIATQARGSANSPCESLDEMLEPAYHGFLDTLRQRRPDPNDTEAWYKRIIALGNIVDALHYIGHKAEARDIIDIEGSDLPPFTDPRLIIAASRIAKIQLKIGKEMGGEEKTAAIISVRNAIAQLKTLLSNPEFAISAQAHARAGELFSMLLRCDDTATDTLKAEATDLYRAITALIGKRDAFSSLPRKTRLEILRAETSLAFTQQLSDAKD